MLKQFIVGILSSAAAYRLFPPPTNDGKSRGGGCILRLISVLIFIGLLCWAVGYAIVVAPTYILLAIYAGLKYLAANGFIALDKLFYPGFEVPPVATWAFWGFVGGTAIQACREMRSSGRKGMGTLAALAPILLLGLNGIIKDMDMPKPPSIKTTPAVVQNTSEPRTEPIKQTKPTPPATNQTTIEPEKKPANPIKPVPTTTKNNTVKTPTTIPKPSIPSVPEGMVLIPAGEFQMGSPENTDEKPIHTVYIDAFYMDKYEVTNAQYKIFLNAKPQWRKDRIPDVYHDGDYLKHWDRNNYPTGKDNHPVTYVSWYAAMAYSKWVGKRLPTEAEWEKAARGRLVGQQYPWGNYIDSTKANYNKNLNGTGFVGRYFPNEYGLYDMAGNVSEWCLDAYDEDFYESSPRQNPIAGGSLLSVTTNPTKVTTARVLRGGSWSVLPQAVRVAERAKGVLKLSYFGTGFRCVQAVIPTMTKTTTTDTQQKTTQRTPVRTTDTPNAAPKARIFEVWVDHKQFEDSVEGMRIHVKFNVHNFKDAKGQVVAYFYKENGDRLKDTNDRYTVAIASDFQPNYVKAVYNDFKLFMPYKELHMTSGKHNLKFRIKIFNLGTWDALSDSSDWVHFTYSR